MDVSHFRVRFLKFRASSDHVVEQIPKLCFEEVTVDFLSVVDLHLKHVGVVVVPNLSQLEDYLYDSVRPAHPRGLVSRLIRQQQHLSGHRVFDLGHLFQPSIELLFRLDHLGDDHLLHNVSFSIGPLDQFNLPQTFMLFAVGGLLGSGIAHFVKIK